MNFRITFANIDENESHINDQPVIFQNKHVLIQGDCLKKKWKNKANEIFFLFGDILGHRNEFKINTNFDDYPLLEDINNISEFEGRFLIVKVSQENNISVWTDILQ